MYLPLTILESFHLSILTPILSTVFSCFVLLLLFRLELTARRPLIDREESQSQHHQQPSLPSPLTHVTSTTTSGVTSTTVDDSKEDDKRNNNQNEERTTSRSPFSSHSSPDAVIASPTEPPSPSSSILRLSFSLDRKQEESEASTSMPAPSSVHDLLSSLLTTSSNFQDGRQGSSSQNESEDNTNRSNQRHNSRRRQLKADEVDEENLKHHRISDSVSPTTTAFYLEESSKKEESDTARVEESRDATTPIPVTFYEKKSIEKMKLSRKFAKLRPKLRTLNNNVTDTDKRKKWSRITYASYVKPRRISLHQVVNQDNRKGGNNHFMHRSSQSFPNETIRVSPFLRSS
jgi:hypothetical protein